MVHNLVIPNDHRHNILEKLIVEHCEHLNYPNYLKKIFYQDQFLLVREYFRNLF